MSRPRAANERQRDANIVFLGGFLKGLSKYICFKMIKQKMHAKTFWITKSGYNFNTYMYVEKIKLKDAYQNDFDNEKRSQTPLSVHS